MTRSCTAVCLGLLLLGSVSLALGDDCPAESYRHKTVKLGIFYTDKFLEQWLSQGGKGTSINAVFPYVTKLAAALSDLYSEKHFGKNSVTFTVDRKNVMQIPSSEVTSFMTGELRHSAVGFCKNKAHQIRKQKQQTWDINFVFVTESEKMGAGSKGVVAQFYSYCSPDKVNCGIITISPNSANVGTFGIFPKLFAHEIGHSLGIPHDSDCNEEPCEKNADTIMNSPGSDGAYWSKWSKLIIDRMFADKLTYKCLKWKCGSYAPDPDSVFAHPEDVKVLDAECAVYGAGIKLDKQKTVVGLRNFILHFTMKQTSYYRVWKNNPEWYKHANICKGYPCKDPNTGRFIGFSAADADGYPCGVGKVCKNQQCVKK